jgi:hypothetical protein
MDIGIIIFVAACLIIGLVGTVLPAVPGVGLIFLGIFAYAWHFGFATVGTGTLIALGIAAVFSLVIDYLGSAYGAKRYGSTGWGVVGSIAGGIIGLVVFNVPGLIIGIFLGAALAEAFFAGKSAEHSLRIGLGSLLGFLSGTILKLFLGLIMIIVFLVTVLF